jgi:hypothetical protein
MTIFTKTGSGQTSEKLIKRGVSCPAGVGVVEVRFLNQDKRDYYQVSRAEVKQVSKRQASHAAAAAFFKTSVFSLFS